jgi:hypothetical protein
MNTEIQEKLDRAYDMFEDASITDTNELILNKKYNVYMLLGNVDSPLMFDMKILSVLSYFTATHHFSEKTAVSKWAKNKIERWFRHDFSISDLQTIYLHTGNMCSVSLLKEFIESDFDMKIFNKEK